MNHALDLNSYKGKFWETRGEIYFLLGDEYQKCIDDMTKAINLSPSANSYFRRGLAYSNLDGYFKEAYDDLQVILYSVMDLSQQHSFFFECRLDLLFHRLT